MVLVWWAKLATSLVSVSILVCPSPLLHLLSSSLRTPPVPSPAQTGAQRDGESPQSCLGYATPPLAPTFAQTGREEGQRAQATPPGLRAPPPPFANGGTGEGPHSTGH